MSAGKCFRKVYLHDNYPSDISATMTIRESLWNLVSNIEAIHLGELPILDTFVGYDVEDMQESHGLPLSFGKQQPPHKKAKKSKKRAKPGGPHSPHQQLIAFSETRCSQNLYMGYNEVKFGYAANT